MLLIITRLTNTEYADYGIKEVIEKENTNKKGLMSCFFFSMRKRGKVIIYFPREWEITK